MLRLLKFIFTLGALFNFTIAQAIINHNIRISGIVTDIGGTSISGALVKLKNQGLTTTTGSSGEFSLVYDAASKTIRSSRLLPQVPKFSIQKGRLLVHIIQNTLITLSIFSHQGKALLSVNRQMESGTHFIPLTRKLEGIVFIKISSNNHNILLKGVSTGKTLHVTPVSVHHFSMPSALIKQAASTETYIDTLTVTKDGYMEYQQSITTADTSGLKIALRKKGSLPKFSFFVTSLKSMQELSGSQDGFGGDLRFGETGPGAGLRGADKICATIAEKSMPGSSIKEWRAFLSAAADENGKQVNAIDRVGNGPWYDRLGRILSNTKEELRHVRPAGAHPQIKNDLPNEFGIPNHDPDGTGPVDNHHFLTGSNRKGELDKISATCNDWTSTEKSAGRPRTGYSWPMWYGAHWISHTYESGCGAGIYLIQGSGVDLSNPVVGSGGGYGGFYCFALNP